MGKARFAEGTFLSLVFGSLALDGSIILGTGISLWWKRQTWRETFGFCNGPAWKVFGMGLLAVIFFLPAGELMQSASIRLLEYFHYSTHPQLAIDEFNRAKSMAGRVYLAGFAIFMAPVAEEILFRGVAYRLLRQVATRNSALILSAALFAAIHFSLPITLPLFVLGIVLGWLYETTGNLATPIVAHSIFNSINIALLFLDSQGGIASPHHS